ncbi:MAG: GrpB family protein [Thermomicrobiales bacterium]
MGSDFHPRQARLCAFVGERLPSMHLMPVESEGWTEMLVFRDYLRQHPETMEAYHRLKQDLAREHGRNGQQYVDGKRAFVLAVVEQARRKVGHTKLEDATSGS